MLWVHASALTQRWETCCRLQDRRRTSLRRPRPHHLRLLSTTWATATTAMQVGAQLVST